MAPWAKTLMPTVIVTTVTITSAPGIPELSTTKPPRTMDASPLGPNHPRNTTDTGCRRDLIMASATGIIRITVRLQGGIDDDLPGDVAQRRTQDDCSEEHKTRHGQGCSEGLGEFADTTEFVTCCSSEEQPCEPRRYEAASIEGHRKAIGSDSDSEGTDAQPDWRYPVALRRGYQGCAARSADTDPDDSSDHQFLCEK